MATVTESEQAAQQAWAAYAERLDGLEGRDYDHAEQDAWEELQATLDALREGSLLPHGIIE